MLLIHTSVNLESSGGSCEDDEGKTKKVGCYACHTQLHYTKYTRKQIYTSTLYVLLEKFQKNQCNKAVCIHRRSISSMNRAELT